MLIPTNSAKHMTSPERSGLVRFHPVVWLRRTSGPLSVIILAALLLSACGPASPRFSSAAGSKKKTASNETESTKTKGTETRSSAETPSSNRDFKAERRTALTPLEQSKLMREISRYMGVPYQLGGSTPSGMDCSGYTCTVFQRALGMQLPRTSVEQSRLGKRVDLEELKFGDLLFFNTSGERSSHVGIYLGDDLFAHASVSLGVTISSLQTPYFKERYEFAKRILD